MQRLTDTAKRLGAETVFTASQAAEGMQFWRWRILRQMT
ncbi:hypothetical protein [Paenibacillus melissococcoides]|nr:hypothetical protein [Paenibacillus melissococcoides]